MQYIRQKRSLTKTKKRKDEEMNENYAPLNNTGITRVKNKRDINKMMSFLRDNKTERTFGLWMEIRNQIIKIQDLKNRKVVEKLNIFFFRRINSKNISGLTYYEESNKIIHFAISKKGSPSENFINVVDSFEFIQDIELNEFKICNKMVTKLNLAVNFGFRIINHEQSCTHCCRGENRGHILTLTKE